MSFPHLCSSTRHSRKHRQAGCRAAGLPREEKLCDDALQERVFISAGDVYDLLGRSAPSQKGAANLFDQARTDLTIRNELNAKIATVPYLMKIAKLGLQFKQKLQLFLEHDLNPYFADLNAVLFPLRNLQKKFIAFKNQLQSPQYKPLTEQEAERLAKQDTRERYGDLADQMSTRPDVKDYFNEQIKRYLMTDRLKTDPNPTIQREKFLAWIKQTISSYQQMRVQNLIAMLTTISEHEGSSLLFNILYEKELKKGGTEEESSFWTQPRLTTEQLKNLTATITPEGEHDPTRLSVNESFNLATWDDWEIIYKKLGLYTKDTNNEKISINPNDDLLIFHSPGTVFDTKVNYFLSKKHLSNPKPGFYSIKISKLYSLAQNYVKSVGKTTLDRGRWVSNQLLFRYNRERDLVYLTDALRLYLTNPDMLKFEKDIQDRVNGEAKINRIGYSLSPLKRARDLLLIQPEDELTGVEWYGNNIHSDFWGDRDAEAPQPKDQATTPVPAETNPLEKYKNSESKIKHGLKHIGDQFNKATQLGKVVIIATTTAAILSGSYYFGKNIGGKVSGNSSSSQSSSLGSGSKPSPLELSKDYETSDADLNSGNGTAFQINNESRDTFFNENKQHPDMGSYLEGLRTQSWPQVSIYRGHSKIPRLFNVASILEVNEVSQMQDITSQFLPRNGDTKLFPDPKDPDSSGMMEVISYRSAVELRTVNGYLFLPKPEGYELASFDFNYVDSPAAAVYYHPQTGQYLIKIKDEHKDDLFRVYATFRRITETPSGNDHPNDISSLQDPRFEQLDHARLSKIVTQLHDAGINKLADQLSLLIAQQTPVSTDDLADLISSTQIYSLAPGHSLAWTQLLSTNPFIKFSRYLRGNVLYMKCDVANALLRSMLTQCFAADADIKIDPIYSYVYSEANNALGMIGHARTQLRVNNIQNNKILDATPRTTEDGFKEEPWEHYSEEQWKKDQDRSKKHRIPLNPDPPKPAMIKTKRFKIVTEPVDPAVLENLIDLHTQKVTNLKEKAKNLLHDSVFKSQVHERDVYPSVRIYRLAKSVLAFSNNEIPLEKLLEKIRLLYPAQEFQDPESSDEMIQILKQISIYEQELWSKLQEHLKKNRRSPYGWADNGELRFLTFDLLDLIQSYHWENPTPLEK